MSLQLMAAQAARNHRSSASFAVWDAAKLPTGITLTSPTLITGNGSLGGYAVCGATTGKSAGKWIFQLTCNYMFWSAGIAADSQVGNPPWQTGHYLGQSVGAHGEQIGMNMGLNAVYYFSATASLGGNVSATTVGAGVVLTIAVDLDSSPQNIKYFNGNTLLKSFDLPSYMAGFTWFPAACPQNVGNTMTINAGQSTITVPTALAGLGYNAFWK